MFKNYLAEIFNVSIEDILRCEEFYTHRKLKKNECVLRQGEIQDQTFFVEKGLLRMYSIDKNGKEHLIQFAPENWLISDRGSVYFNQTSEYYIDAIEESEVISFQPSFFKKLREIDHQVSEQNTLLLHKHILHLQKRLKSLLSDSAEERYLDFLKMYPNVFQRVPQWMVASYLGITPESLSRVRKEIANKGI